MTESVLCTGIGLNIKSIDSELNKLKLCAFLTSFGNLLYSAFARRNKTKYGTVLYGKY